MLQATAQKRTAAKSTTAIKSFPCYLSSNLYFKKYDIKRPPSCTSRKLVRVISFK